MKRFVLFFVLLGTWNYLLAQVTLSGQVTDTDGKPLAGALVKINNTYVASYSDANGHFSLVLKQTGTYQIQASAIGYVAWADFVNLQANMELQIALKQQIIDVGEITVSATRADNNTPMTFTDLKQKEIQQKNWGQDIPYLLKLTPSLVTSSDAGAGVGYTSMSVRGSDVTRINVTVNGIPLNDAESQGVWWVNMPDFASSVGSIQVQRGVGTSTNGAGAFGATVNLATAKPDTIPYTQTSLSVGSFGTMKSTLMIGTGLMKSGFNFDARLSQISSDGFIDRAASRLRSYFVSGGYYGKRSSVTFNVFSGSEHTYQAWWGVPRVLLDNDTAGMRRYLDHWLYTPQKYDEMLKTPNPRTYNYYTYDNETDNYTQSHAQVHYNGTFDNNFSLQVSLHGTLGSGYYENYQYDAAFADYTMDNPIVNNDTITNADMVVQKWLDNVFYGATYALKHTHKVFDFTVGGGYNIYSGSHFGDVVWAKYADQKPHRWYEGKGYKADHNIFVKASYKPIEWLNVYADLQFRGVNYSINGTHDDLRTFDIEKRYPFFNPKGGVWANFGKYGQAYASVAVAHREPTRDVLRDADSSHTALPERLIDVETGYKIQRQQWFADVCLFAMQYRDQLVLTGEINNVGAPIKTNVPDSYRRGIEVSTGVQMPAHITAQGNIALSDNKIVNYVGYIDDWDTGAQQTEQKALSNLSFSPATTAGFALRAETFKPFYVELSGKYVGKQYIDNSENEQRALKAYFVTDAQVGLQFDKIKYIKQLQINMQTNNLLDHQYESWAWVYRYRLAGTEYQMDGYFPQAGRHFLISINAKF